MNLNVVTRDILKSICALPESRLTLQMLITTEWQDLD